MKTVMDLHLAVANNAVCFVGVGEQGGDNKGPFVEQFQKAIDGVASGEPWCVGFCAAVVKITTTQTSVPSPIFWSESALDTWDLNPKLRRQVPEPGFIAIWKMGKGRKGHAGIVIAAAGNDFGTVEGNTSASGGADQIVREGDVVARKARHLGVASENFKLLGFLDPYPSV